MLRSAILTILFGLLLSIQTLASEFASPIPGYGFEHFSWGLEVLPGRRMILNGTIQEAIAQAVHINPKFKFDNTVTAISDVHALNKRKYTNWISKPNCDPPGHRDWGYADFEEITDAARMLADGKGENGHGEALPKGKPKMTPGPGMCGRVSCEGSSAIYWCNDSHDAKELNSYSDIADAAIRIAEFCPPGGGVDKKKTKGQQFTSENWNVIVRADNCCHSELGTWQIC
ncbi:hypothetical protein E2P81_ATG03514 [Venturia nashicola]|uniref:Uncharacterized protein n=1 Tax=Venturia nashicola TaxID=86259 RepID=A0A4Z1PSD2_9PEZI|nr:hypothetical protein E6O75_ATG03587 [Venturia nashicola]TLD37839.1 hypothetical protein E2P81_ATG03514 [Venturia nashicola]